MEIGHLTTRRTGQPLPHMVQPDQERARKATPILMNIKLPVQCQKNQLLNGRSCTYFFSLVKCFNKHIHKTNIIVMPESVSPEFGCLDKHS